MFPDFEHIEESLRKGIRLSGQGSYGRRAPSPESLPFLQDAELGLRHLVGKDPTNEKGWRLLSQAQECFLKFHEAISSLEQAMRLAGTRTKQDLKRLARLRQYAGEWSDLGLSPWQLKELGEHLKERLAQEPSGRTLRWTKEWVRQKGLDMEPVVKALEQRGAFSDMQVLYNVVRG